MVDCLLLLILTGLVIAVEFVPLLFLEWITLFASNLPNSQFSAICRCQNHSSRCQDSYLGTKDLDFGNNLPFVGWLISCCKKYSHIHELGFHSDAGSVKKDSIEYVCDLLIISISHPPRSDPLSLWLPSILIAFSLDGRQFICSLWEFLPGVAVVLSAIPSVPVTITGSVLSAYDYFFPLPYFLPFMSLPYIVSRNLSPLLQLWLSTRA